MTGFITNHAEVINDIEYPKSDRNHKLSQNHNSQVAYGGFTCFCTRLGRKSQIMLKSQIHTKAISNVDHHK